MMPNKNTKILLTQNGTVQISDELSAPSTSCESPISSSRNSLYSSLDNDEFDEGVMDESDMQGKIHINDELHLVSEATRSSSLLNLKMIFMLALNLVFILLAVTWLIGHNFQMDLLGTIFVTLSAWMLFINIITTIKALSQIRERNMLNGRPDDFRDYVKKLQNSQQPDILIRNNDKLINTTRIIGRSTNGAIFV